MEMFRVGTPYVYPALSFFGGGGGGGSGGGGGGVVLFCFEKVMHLCMHVHRERGTRTHTHIQTSAHELRKVGELVATATTIEY